MNGIFSLVFGKFHSVAITPRHCPLWVKCLGRSLAFFDYSFMGVQLYICATYYTISVARVCLLKKYKLMITLQETLPSKKTCSWWWFVLSSEFRYSWLESLVAPSRWQKQWWSMLLKGELPSLNYFRISNRLVNFTAVFDHSYEWNEDHQQVINCLRSVILKF